jgi:hypothetical protein
LSLIYDL